MPVATKSAPVATAPVSASDGLNGRARSAEGAQGTMVAFNGHRRTPPPINEPIRSYAPGTAERAELKARLESMANEVVDIPIVIDGREIRTGDTANVVMPHAHQHVLGQWHAATVSHVAQAIDAAERARADWGNWPFEERAGVFLRAAELLSTRYRATLNAATMLGQSKTAFQAEVDAACELADFWRFNVHFAETLYADQPISDKGIWNQTDYRPLEGFIYAVTPFNFTAIGGNLSTAPALMGNTVLWKPSATAMLSAHYIMQILTESGLPPGVINFLPGDPIAISNAALSHRDFAGLHFTGSTNVFNMMWKQIGANTSSYRSYPRIVGETGGKDFIVAHHTADVEALAVAIGRGGFEYQGQKCSACSRAIVEAPIYDAFITKLLERIAKLTVGDPAANHYLGPVINKAALDSMLRYIEIGKKEGRLLAGGKAPATADGGYFLEPTVIADVAPNAVISQEEIFGPVLALVKVASFEEGLKVVNNTEYGLTGSIYSTDREKLNIARREFHVGNLYFNRKCTGAMVGAHPFGGFNMSGTDSKAGGPDYLPLFTQSKSVAEKL